MKPTPPGAFEFVDLKNGGPLRAKPPRRPPPPSAPKGRDWGLPENPGPARAFAYWQAVGAGFIKWWKSTKEARRQRRQAEKEMRS